MTEQTLKKLTIVAPEEDTSEILELLQGDCGVPMTISVDDAVSSAEKEEWQQLCGHEREWVFTKPDSTEVVGRCPEEDCIDAADALRQFSREYGGHFDIYFRTRDGRLHSTTAESSPEDF